MLRSLWGTASSLKYSALLPVQARAASRVFCRHSSDDSSTVPIETAGKANTESSYQVAGWRSKKEGLQLLDPPVIPPEGNHLIHMYLSVHKNSGKKRPMLHIKEKYQKEGRDRFFDRRVDLTLEEWEWLVQLAPEVEKAVEKLRNSDLKDNEEGLGEHQAPVRIKED